MANSKLIVVEGPQGAGKTFATDYIRYFLPHTNLYRLCGTNDASKAGLKKATDMYQNLLNYIKDMENLSINLLFDRTFFTEEVYCRLGFKEYSFSEVFYQLLERFNQLDFEIYYITLYLENTDLYYSRLERTGKGITSYAKYDKNSSIYQQKTYLDLAEEIKSNFPNIHVFNVSNDGEASQLQEKLHDILETPQKS